MKNDSPLPLKGVFLSAQPIPLQGAGGLRNSQVPASPVI